jgi:2-phospho-L-lactate guanylyltransferase
MLRDVLDVVTSLNRATATVLSQPGLDIDIAEVYREGRDGRDGSDVEILESELDLNDALNSLIAEEASHGWPSDILIVVADLALLTGEDVAGILGCDGDVVLCPGRGGGTNMILIRSPIFRTCYRGLSFPKHLQFAGQAGMKASVFESFRAGCDIDEPEDLAEVLIHGHGESRHILLSMGFCLSEKGRSKIVRTATA